MGPANPQALNRYSYVLNNPLRYTDPTGHEIDESFAWSYISNPKQANDVLAAIENILSDAGSNIGVGAAGASLNLAMLNLGFPVYNFLVNLADYIKQALSDAGGWQNRVIVFGMNVTTNCFITCAYKAQYSFGRCLNDTQCQPNDASWLTLYVSSPARALGDYYGAQLIAPMDSLAKAARNQQFTGPAKISDW